VLILDEFITWAVVIYTGSRSHVESTICCRVS